MAQAPRPAWRLPKHLPWLAAPTLATARGSRAGAARGNEPGRQQHQHWVQGTGIPRAPSFHPKGEPPLLGHPSTRGVRGGASPHLWRAADFPRSTSTGGATSSDVELVSLAPLPPPLQLWVPWGRPRQPSGGIPAGTGYGAFKASPAAGAGSCRRCGRGRLDSEPSCMGKFITSLEVLSEAESERPEPAELCALALGRREWGQPRWPLLPRSRALRPAPQPGGCGEVPGLQQT